MPNFDNLDNETARASAGAKARGLLAAGAGIAAGASLAVSPAAAAAADPGTSPLGIAAHKRFTRHSGRRHHSAFVLSPELLTVGDRGAAVSQVQRALHRHATGYFGSGTRQAVARFQRRHRLPADGVVGPRTRRSMHLHVRIIAPQAPAAAPAATSASTTSTQPTAPQSTGSSGYAIPSSVIQCESGGNANAVSPFSGGGLYGILDSSWQAFGGTAYAPHPYDASVPQQTVIANRILASQGPSAWQCWK